ncbi:hypothetical protein J4E91_005868 [Alternaria rosae]|nr:hypothetical protein J4E91_005868 [Alternaria rosae]
MSNQPTQVAAVVTPALHCHHKRRRSSSISLEQAVLPPGAGPSNDENDPTTTPHGQRHPDDITIHERKRKAHGVKRRRIAGSFKPVHGSDLISGGDHSHKNIIALPVGDTPCQPKPITDTMKQAPQTPGLGRRNKFKVWQDEPQPPKSKGPTPAAVKLLQEITNTGVRRRCSRIPSHKPRFCAQDTDYYYHPNLKDFHFPQGVVATTEEDVEEAAQRERDAPTTEATQKIEDAQLEVTQSLKRKANNDLREGGTKRLRKLNYHQPLPWIVNGKIRCDPVQDFTTEYFTISVQSISSVPAEDVNNTAGSDQSQTEIDTAIEKDEAQQLPTPIPEPVSNEILSSIASKDLKSPNIVHVPGNNETALDKTQDDGFSANEMNAFEGFGTYQPPPSNISAAAQPSPKIVTTVPSLIKKKYQPIIETGVAYSQGYDPGNPQNSKNYLAQFTDRPAALWSREREYRPIPEMLGMEAMNQRLDWVIPNVAEAPTLFRKMPTPPSHIDSELARCVRFAQSDTQRRVNWRAHPSHVAEIIQRTNFYGMELLVSRSEMRISSPLTADEFELGMATRLAHVSFGMDVVDYCAADVPAITNYFMENLPSAISVFPSEDEDFFRGFTDHYRVMFTERYPPLNALGLLEWESLLAAEEGRPSLKARTLRGIVQSIKGLSSQRPGDADGTHILKDVVSHEKPDTGNEHLDHARLELGQALGVGRSSFVGDVQWHDQLTNAAFPNEVQNEKVQHYDTNSACYGNNTEVSGEYSDLSALEADAGITNVNVEYDAKGWCCADPKALIPWYTRLNPIPSGFGTDLSYYGAIATYFNPSTLGPFDDDAETNALL